MYTALAFNKMLKKIEKVLSFRSQLKSRWLTGSLDHLAHEIIKGNSIRAAGEYVAVTQARRSNL